MTPTTAAPGLASLRAAADEADSRFQNHYDVCPSRRTGWLCQKCSDLDLLANAAESAYRAARLAGAGVAR